MKKIVSFVMAALVLVQIFAYGITVFAVEPASVSLSSVEGRAGDEVVLSVSVANNTGFGGIHLNAQFDKNVLEFVSAECKLADGYFQFSPAASANADGEIALAYVGTENVTSDGVLFDIKFNIKESATEGDSNVTLVLDPSSFVYDGVIMNDFTANVNSGKVTVANGLLGDVNLDGAIDAKDLTLLARHSAKIESLTDSRALANADINKDGSITAADLTKLARHVAKIESIVQ
jgi:hypothetical protein